MSFHTSNKSCKDIITTSIPWRPDTYINYAQVGDWINNIVPNTGAPFDWVYYVLDSTASKVNVIEFQKISPSGRIQATSHQALTLSTENYLPVRVLSQEKQGAALRVAKEPLTPGKKALLYWVFESGFIKDLPWDPREWH
jgi:hypothetical protein